MSSLARPVSQTATYILGHSSSVLETQRRRTPQTDAAFLLPHLRPDTNLLDVGWGPGTLTASFATLCPSGHVTGVDLEANIIEQATVSFGHMATFQQANVYHLPFAEDSFDVVHAHQVFQYLSDVPAALKELYRVLQRGGVIGIRSASFRHSLGAPDSMQLFNNTFSRSIEVTGGNPQIGFQLPALMSKASFREVRSSVSNEHYCGTDREKIATELQGNINVGGLGKKWIEMGVAKKVEIDLIHTSFERLKQCDTGFYSIPSVEVLGWKYFI